ncbi:MAG TPA: c-type cytochrome biogenesis protein CcsB [Kineosporiaceae bacterium]
MAVDENLAQVSNTLIYSAMLVYTGALGAYTADLAIRGRHGAGEPAGRPRVVPAGVGASGGSSSGSRSSSAGHAADGVDDAGPAVGASRLRTKAGGIGVSLTCLAFLLHAGGVLTRGLSVQRVPWGNMYEFSVAGSAVVTATFLAVVFRRDVRYLGAFVVGPVLLTLGLAVAVFYTQADQLVPALHSFWLLIHVSVAFVASALYTLGFSTTILQLVQERRERARAAGRPPARGRFMDALPSAAALDRSSYSLHVAAFPLWTFTVLAGAIWAESAWGRYWNWDPKETWSFVIWVVYAGHLHARATRGWDGRKAAYLVLAGYACILMNFMIVNVFFVGRHSYGGL